MESNTNRSLLLTIAFAVSALLWTSPSFAERLDLVQVRGNQRIEADTVRLQLESKQGSELDQQVVERDIKELYRTGFFDQVVARIDRSGGRTALVFDVVEKPAIRNVLLQGNDAVSSETLKEKLSVGERRFLDRRKIKAGIQEAKKYYESKGYYGSEIEVLEEEVSGNQVDLTFVVKEGEKKVIRELVFEGVSQVDEDELEDAIKTSTYSWWSSWITGSGILNREQLDNDVRELSNYYLSHGFVEVKVGEPVVEHQEDGLRLVFKISEGEIFEFGNISASGTLLSNSQEKTLDGVESKEGETFDVTKLRKDTFTVSEKFTDIGYAFANVEPMTNINRERKKVDIDFKVDKGSIVTVNRIGITGNKKTADNVIRRSLQIQEQELFSSSRIKRSQELLKRLGYFDEVSINPEPSEYANMVDLNVGVKEASTGSFSFGAGVSSGEGFIATARIAENNFMGTGRIISFDVNTGSERDNYVLSIDDPRVNDTKWSVGVDALSTDREFDDFERSQAGGAVTVGHPLSFLGEDLEDDYRASLRYELVNVDISDVDFDAPELVRDQEGETVASGVTPKLVRNTIDNPLDPENGSRQVASIELTGIGGDQEFWLGEFSNSWYYPLVETSFGNLVFAQRTRVGYGETFNNEDFPLYKRYFPGGINSVRGYEARELGPKDEQGNEYGGSKELIANFELLFPLFQSIGLKGLVFYDAGDAFDDDDNIDIGELRQAAGFGIRWRSPLAPIRIEFGWPLDKEEGDKSFVTNFTFGAPS